MKQRLNKDWTDAIREKAISDGAMPSRGSWEIIGRRMRRDTVLRRSVLSTAAVALPLALLLLWHPIHHQPSVSPVIPDLIGDLLTVEPPATPSHFPDLSIIIPDLIEEIPVIPDLVKDLHDDPIIPDPIGGQHTTASLTQTPPSIEQALCAKNPPLEVFNDPPSRHRINYSVSMSANAVSTGRLSTNTRQLMDLYPLALNRLNTMMINQRDAIMGPGSKTSQRDNEKLWSIWTDWYHQELTHLETSHVTMPAEEWLGYYTARWRHDIPLSVSVTVRAEFLPRFMIETGLEYTYLHSIEDLSGIENQAWFGKGPTPTDEEKTLSQHVHFIGIPVRVTYQAWSPGRFDFYFGLGIKGDKCIKAQFGQELIKEPRLQWSAEAFGGIEYRIFSKTHLYFQPAFSWYFTHTNLITYRTENPLGFSLQAGLRFDLK